MKIPHLAASLALMAGATLTAHAADPSEDLARRKNCLGCHQIDRKVVGPAYQDVAAKYAGQKDAATALAAKIIAGGAGVWGQLPMPANPQVTEAEARQLTQWILGLKPPKQPK